MWEIWGALLHGGRLVVVPEMVAGSPEDFHAVLVAEQVGVSAGPPLRADALSPEGLESTALVVAGEACPAEVVVGGRRGASMINAYGPDRDDDVRGHRSPSHAGSGMAPIGAGARRGLVRAGWVVASGAGRARLVSCMWQAMVWRAGIGSAGVDCVAVCGVPVRRAGGADVSQRGFGVLGC